MPTEKEFKTYESLIYRKHRIGNNNIIFDNGYYTAKSKKEEEMIESDPLFGLHITVSQK